MGSLKKRRVSSAQAVAVEFETVTRDGFVDDGEGCLHGNMISHSRGTSIQIELDQSCCQRFLGDV